MKIWIIVAVSLILLGCIVFTVGMANKGWNFYELSTTEYETVVHDIKDDFSDISFDVDTAHVKFVISENTECRVECLEDKKTPFDVKVVDGKLTAKLSDERKWYDHIGINLKTPTLTVYLPKSEYSSLELKGSTGKVEIAKNVAFESVDISISTGSVKLLGNVSGLAKIKTTTGRIHVENIFAGGLDVSVTTGRVKLVQVNCLGDINVNVSTGKTDMSEVSCVNFTSSGSTGDIYMQNLAVAGKLRVIRDTGDVEFENSDAAELYIKTDTGDVEGSLRSDKVFMVKTNTGDVEIPRTTTGGVCEIYTDTGDVELEISK